MTLHTRKRSHLAWAAAAVLGLAAVVLRVFPGACAEISWQHLDRGLDLLVHQSAGTRQVMPDLVLLRIDPREHEFQLLTAGEEQSPPLGIDEWVRSHGLVAAINASMYWEDQSTSTGYMRNYDHLNNSRVHPWFGAFFVANPKTAGLPAARVIDRKAGEDWPEVLAGYETVVQNYRIISSDGSNAWLESSKRFSIAAVGEDSRGNILFILSLSPRQVRDLGTYLLDLPLDMRTTMYVEGGASASLYVKAGGFEAGWAGLDELSFWPTAHHSYRAVPNVIGIVKKNVSPDIDTDVDTDIGPVGYPDDDPDEEGDPPGWDTEKSNQ